MEFEDNTRGNRVAGIAASKPVSDELALAEDKLSDNQVTTMSGRQTPNQAVDITYERRQQQEQLSRRAQIFRRVALSTTRYINELLREQRCCGRARTLLSTQPGAQAEADAAVLVVVASVVAADLVVEDLAVAVVVDWVDAHLLKARNQQRKDFYSRNSDSFATGADKSSAGFG